MKFTIQGDRSMVADQKELQPAFVKGALAAHAGGPGENPYRRPSFREAWNLGYQGVKQGKVTVEDENGGEK